MSDLIKRIKVGDKEYELSTNYDYLENKPTIPTKTSQLANDNGYITGYTETDPTVPSYVKSITTQDIEKWNKGGYDDTEIKADIKELQDNQFSGEYNDLKNKPTLFSGDYNDLTNKPTIPEEYTLPTASDSTLGGIKVGENLTIDENGVLSASGSSELSGKFLTISDGIGFDISTAEVQAYFIDMINNLSYDDGAYKNVLYRYFMKKKSSTYMDYVITHCELTSATTGAILIRFNGISGWKNTLVSNNYGVDYRPLMPYFKFYLYVNPTEYASHNITNVYTNSAHTKKEYMTLNELYSVYGVLSTATIIGTTNTTAYTPTSNYHPATKKYVDDAVSTALGTIETELSEV